MRYSPCIDCDERNVYCHSSCPDYKEFEQKCKEDRERRRAVKQSEYFSKNAEKYSEKKKRRKWHV